MLDLIRFKINRLKEAKAWLLSNTNANVETFKAKFSDVDEMISLIKPVEIKPVEVQPVQYVKQKPTSSFVSFQ